MVQICETLENLRIFHSTQFKLQFATFLSHIEHQTYLELVIFYFFGCVGIKH
jgi:hypothetical protein